MKKRRPTRRKQFRQAPKRLPPTSTSRPAQGPIAELGQLRPQVSNAVLDPIGTRETPLPLREAAKRHQEMLSWVEVLEALIVELPNQRRGIGHNLQPITEQDVQAITKCIVILKHQPVAPKAPGDARAAGSTLKKIGEKLGTYLDTCLLEASKEVGKRLVQLPYWLALWYTLKHIVQSVAGWLP